MANKKENQLKIINETFKLLSASVDALAKSTQTQDDEMVLNLLGDANRRLWESRYWLSEAMAYLGEKIKREGN